MSPKTTCHKPDAGPCGPSHEPKRRRASYRIVVFVILLIPVLVMTAQADQIVTAKVNYLGAGIVGMDKGRLRFRSADGTLQGAWPDEIELIIVDRGGIFDDFNQAERLFARNEPARAILRYRRMLRLSEDFWADLVAARLVLACDAAGHLDTATLNFIRLLRGSRGGPPAAARLIPSTIPKAGNRRVQRALEQLGAALSKRPDESQRALLLLLRYEILRRSGDPRAIQAVKSIAGLSIPANARSERVYEIQLHALRTTSVNDVNSGALTNLHQAIRDCPDTVLPDLLLLKGDMLFKTAAMRDDIVRSSWPFLRVAIHYPDDPRGTEGQYRAALVLERLGNTDKAIELLEECVGHKYVTTETRRGAEAAVERLRAGGP